MEALLKIRKTIFASVLLYFCLLTSLTSQTEFRIDTLINSEHEVIILTDRFYNPLTSEELLTLDLNEDRKPFMIINFIKDDKFSVFRNGTLVYSGEGSWDKLRGDHRYESNFDIITGTFVNGNLDGLLVYLNKKTDQRIEKTYKDGLLDGTVIKRNRDGGILYYCKYKKGQRNGLEYQLYDNQILRFCNHFTLGILNDGTYHSYDGEGNVISIKKVKDGKVVETKYY